LLGVDSIGAVRGWDDVGALAAGTLGVIGTGPAPGQGMPLGLRGRKIEGVL